MRPLRVLLVLWLVFLAVDLAPGTPPRVVAAGGGGSIDPPPIARGQLLLGFLPGFGEATRDALIAAQGGETLARLDTLDARLVRVRGARPLGEVARAFAASGMVRYAEPNAVAQVAAAPNDPRVGEQWALRQIGVTDAGGNWLVPTGDRAIVVGVVDSGVDYDHPDLRDNIWSAPTGWSVGGCTADSHGYRAIGGVTSCDPRDDLPTAFVGGTGVAGVIGAVGNNGIGISGLNQQVGIMALKCVDSQGFVQVADAVKVIEYAIAAKRAGVNLRVLVIGWTTGIYSRPLEEAVAAAGAADILVVAAAGNSSASNDTNWQYPSRFGVAPYNFSHVIGVMGSDRADARAGGMNYGAASVHLAAPGDAILTTTSGARMYESQSHSSLAAGYVGGAAALTIAATAGQPLSVADLRSRLLKCGDRSVDLTDVTTTGRRLNVARTIANTDCDYTLRTTVAHDAANGQIAVSPNQPTYRSGTMVTVSAIPTEGYRLEAWEIDGQLVGRADRLSLTIDADRSVVAYFVKRTHRLAIEVVGTGSGGSVAASPPPSDGVYEWGTVVRLTATARDGARFVGWMLDDVPAGSEPTLSVPMTRDHRVVATFAPIVGPSPSPSPSPSPGTTYPLTLTATAGGSAAAVPGGGAYAPNARVALGATPEAGYVFTGWTIDGLPAGRANPYTITMTGARRAVANFAPARTLLISSTSGGRVDASAATWADESPYPLGTVVTLTATTASNGLFTGWTIDGVFMGWANPLTITMDGSHAVVATFAARPRFGDLPPGPPPYEAISQLAARGIIKGYANGDFGPNDTTLRVQMAALIVRAMGWGEANPPNPFSDRAGVDDELWRAVAILAARDVARGYGDGTYGTADPVLQVQTIAFITRAMVRAGRWEWQPDNPALYAHIPLDSGHRADLSTYVYYVGAPPGAEPSATWAMWSAPATRGWFAQALWQALDGYYRVDRVP